MNRRQMFAAVLSFIALPTLAISCQQRIEGLVFALGRGIGALAALIGDSALADKLRKDVDAVIAAIRAFKENDSPARVVHLINELIRDLKVLESLGAKFKALIDYSLGTLAAIIEYFRGFGGGAGVEQPDTDIRVTEPPKTAHEFEHVWDAIRAGSVNMKEAPIL